MAAELAHLVIAAAIGYLLFRTMGWIRHQSSVVGAIVTAGLLARTFIGVSLFFISYTDSPILRPLHSGDGFWTLAVDARGYYEEALLAAERGLLSVDRGGASPFFVQMLGAWMLLVGSGPAVGLYLNVCLYVAVMAALVWLFNPVDRTRRDLPLIVGALALSVSPVLIIHGTQTLKDELFTTLIAAACLGALLALRALAYGDRCARPRRDAVAGVAILAAATYGIAGMRAYYAVIVWASLALTLVLFSARQTPRGLLRYIPAALGTLLLVWFAYRVGAGPYHQGPDLSRLTPSTVAVAAQQRVDRARAGFIMSGGDTNMAIIGSMPMLGTSGTTEATPARSASALNTDARLRGGIDCGACPPGLGENIRVAARGVAGVLIPISILKATSVVTFSGGRSLLPIADVDALVLDSSVAVLLFLLYRRRRELDQHMPAVVFLLILSGVTTILLGYVVTNFGTLFRLRLLMAVPLWMLPLTMMRPSDREASPRVSPS